MPSNKPLSEIDQLLSNQRSRLWRGNNPTRKRMIDRRYWMKKCYGLSENEFTLMLASQFGCCAICGLKLTKRGHIDHNHKTGKIRGILCKGCNAGLGFLKDDINVLQKALLYLLKHKDA